jgi:hypothetical protein
MSVQELECIGVSKVLKLQTKSRVNTAITTAQVGSHLNEHVSAVFLLAGGEEFIDEGMELRSANSRLAKTHVRGIISVLGTLSSHIDVHRQALCNSN